MEADMIAAIGIWVTIVGMILWQSSRRHNNRIDALDTKVGNKIDGLEAKFDKEFKAVHGEFKQVRREMAGQGERLARIEGHLLGPKSFSPPPPSPPPAEPDDDGRQAS